MNIALIGSGGREHALCQKIHESKLSKNIICIPGNAGTAKIAKNINLDFLDFKKLLKIIKSNKINLVIVGPEEPLVKGVVDFLTKHKIKVFGPNKYAAKLEGSKAFMKSICKKNKIPTAEFKICKNKKDVNNFLKNSNFPLVVKADGLAAGKGVTICKNKRQILNVSNEIFKGKFKTSKKLILEEFLEGDELSYFLIVDKNSYHFFGSAQDHKKLEEGDKGLNTGGMGAYSPAALLTKKLEEKIIKKIIEPTIKGMKKLGHPYKGFLYAGLMINKGEPYLIEYNIRMGDPECQALMMRLETDLLEIIDLATKNKINNLKIKWNKKNSITIVLCAKGYPSNYIKNSEIKNLSNAIINKNNQIFHAGTYRKKNSIYSIGGRVLNIASAAEDLNTARNMCLNNISKINWKDGFFRKDIGWRAINNK